MQRTHLMGFKLGVVMWISWMGPGQAWAWHDRTHQAVAQAAGGDDCVCAAIAPDAAAQKFPQERPNHFFNPDPALPFNISESMVYAQARRYNTIEKDGHLYGAVLAAFRQSRSTRGYPVYKRGALAHYIGDLVQPLHNSPYDTFNRAHHHQIDGVLDDEADGGLAGIVAHMDQVVIADERAAVAQIIRLAHVAHEADKKLRSSSPVALSKEDAYALLGQGASVLKAMFACPR